MSYQPIVLPADLKTQMYPEVQAIITRGDTSIASECIDLAISEAKMYLTRYDPIQLFGDAGTGTPASFNDALLNGLIKSVAVWNLLRLANPNADLSLALTWYEKAIGTLKSIQKGIASPPWPYLDTTGEAAPPGDSIYAHSNPKRRTHF